MKAISLWQPWSGFIALGLKRIETRSWSTSYRGPLAIHAAKRWTRDQRHQAFDLLPTVMPNPGVRGAEALRTIAGEENRGAVLALADLVDCREMDPEWIAAQSDVEIALGGWEPGRFGWVLENVRALVEPYSLTGRQGLWGLAAGEAESIRLLADLP